MRARQAVIVEPFKVEVREVELPAPAANQILVAAEVSAVSAGTELAVYTGTHQWLKDPNLPDWKFPFRPGYSAAGDVVAVGSDVHGLEAGRPRQLPRQPRLARAADASATSAAGCGSCPTNLDAEKAALACIARYGLGASIRAGLTLGRSAAVLGLGIIGQFALRVPAGGRGVPGRRHRRAWRCAARPPWPPGPTTSSTRRPATRSSSCTTFLGTRGRGDRRRRDRRAGRGPDGDVAGLRRRAGGRRRQPARQGEGRQLLRRPAPPLHRGDRGARQHALRAGPHAAGRGLGHRQGADTGCWRRSPPAG